MPDAGRFAGKIAVVTGGAHGIGLATAQRLAGEGARVVVIDMDEDALATAARIEGIDSARADVATQGEVESGRRRDRRTPRDDRHPAQQRGPAAGGIGN